MGEEALVIYTIDDLERILIERPDWKERIRKLILTEDLMVLPEKFDRFVEEEFKPLKNDVEILKKDVEILKKDVEILKKDVEILKEDVKKLKEDVGELKGDMFELQVERRAGSYFGRVIKKIKILDNGEVADVLYEAMERGIINERELESGLAIDLVAKGFLRSRPEEESLLAVEVSYRADRGDVERAFERAMILRKAFQLPAYPVVIGKRFTQGAKKRAQELSVILL